MKLTDYKFWYIRRDDDVHISECAVRFYEGEVTTEDEIVNGELVPVTRYRRTKKLNPKKDIKHTKTKKMKKDSKGKNCVVYTTDDFGVISTDDELRTFLNGELSKDKARQNVPEQE